VSGGPSAVVTRQPRNSAVCVELESAYGTFETSRDVTSLARPGGNATGMSVLFTQLTPKLLELISEIVPQVRIVGLLVNPNSPTAEPTIRDAQEAARAKGVQLSILKASTESEIDAAFAALISLRADAVIVGADPFLGNQRLQLIAQAAHHKIPAIYFSGGFTASGGLISYGANLPAVYRRMGVYAGKILKGEKPANLPVEQPTKFDLSINLKAAKALGLTIRNEPGNAPRNETLCRPVCGRCTVRQGEPRNSVTSTWRRRIRTRRFTARLRDSGDWIGSPTITR
jgi:putative tryptophan/tyrosine transport system substrate-binding protein